MFIVIVALFAICWLPYHGYFVLVNVNHKLIPPRYAQQIFLAFYWLAMSNAMINPVVYYWMNIRSVTQHKEQQPNFTLFVPMNILQSTNIYIQIMITTDSDGISKLSSCAACAAS